MNTSYSVFSVDCWLLYLIILVAVSVILCPYGKSCLYLGYCGSQSLGFSAAFRFLWLFFFGFFFFFGGGGVGGGKGGRGLKNCLPTAITE